MCVGEFMAIKALIFDFDGLILDTETPEFESWQTIFEKYGYDLPFSEWKKCVGSSNQDFEPTDYLGQLMGHPVNKKKVEHEKRILSLARIMSLPPLPGVEDMIKSAHARGIKLAVASSSSTEWVWLNLSRLGLHQYFDAICGGNEVLAVKPDPALYLKAMAELEVQPDEAVVFEDSPNGILAAQRAGIFCVAIPNPISIQMGVDHADLIVNSMAEINIDKLETILAHHSER
jgi:HAD superfamily hydrolase (TIGR01509 family)